MLRALHFTQDIFRPPMWQAWQALSCTLGPIEAAFDPSLEKVLS